MVVIVVAFALDVVAIEHRPGERGGPHDGGQGPLGGPLADGDLDLRVIEALSLVVAPPR